MNHNNLTAQSLKLESAHVEWLRRTRIAHVGGDRKSSSSFDNVDSGRTNELLARRVGVSPLPKFIPSKKQK